MFDTSEWKPSSYNLILNGKDGMVLFNSVSGQSLWLDNARLTTVEHCLAGLGTSDKSISPELAKGLAQLGFAVPASVDERWEEYQKFKQTRDHGRRLYLTIAPTMRCNMRCSYCFQQNAERNRIMSADMQAGVVEFARRKSEGMDALVVMWFGGEPLLAWPQICEMSDALQRHCSTQGIAYHAELISNGLLLTPSIISDLDRLSVRTIQISLDGYPETYATRRHIPIDKAQRYYSFLAEHMQDIIDATGSVTLRINVDRENIDEARDVVKLFKNAGVVDRRIDFRLGFLNTSREIIDCIPHDCFSGSEFAAEEDAFRRFLADEGYMVFGMPQPKSHPCTAPLRNSFTIDPDGAIGKCVPGTGTRQSVMAQIYPSDINRTLEEINSASHPYNDFDPFQTEECRNCVLLPSCLGSCPKSHVNGHIKFCPLKENLTDMLSFYGAFHHVRASLA